MFFSRSRASKVLTFLMVTLFGVVLLSPKFKTIVDTSKNYALPVIADFKFSPGVNQASLNPNSIVVPLKADDRALMLDAKIDHGHIVTLVLDTGATYTSISREVAENMGYDLENCEKVWVTTANGRVALPKIMIKELNINGFTVHNIEATVMDLPAKVPFSGLLGLSFIKKHRITIDTNADNLIIEPETEQS